MIRIGKVDDFDDFPNPLNDEPIVFRESRAGDAPGMVWLVFDRKADGCWKNSCQYETDAATAAKVEAFCKDRATRGVPLYRRDLEEIFILKVN